MNHPTREEWMSFIYGETSAGERNGLRAHLRGCPDCQARLNQWQGTQTALNDWNVCPPPLARAKRSLGWLVRPVLKWAAAAALLLSAGFGLGQFASARVAADKVRAQIEPQLRQELRQEMAELLRQQARNAADAQARHERDSQALYTAVRNVDAQRLADYLLLKKELDTVAVNTDAGLRLTRQQLFQLADYKEPADSSNAPQN